MATYDTQLECKSFPYCSNVIYFLMTVLMFRLDCRAIGAWDGALWAGEMTQSSEP